MIPAYLAFTRTDSAEHRQRTATLACIVAGIALLIFAAGGDLIRKQDVALTPLAVPMLAGPGAMSTVMVPAAQARSPAYSAVVYVSIVVTMVLSWLTLRAADRLFVRIGETGIRVATRLMGLLLAAIAVQFVLTGIRDAQLLPGAGPAGGGDGSDVTGSFRGTTATCRAERAGRMGAELTGDGTGGRPDVTHEVRGARSGCTLADDLNGPSAWTTIS